MIEIQSLQNELIRKHSFTKKEADFFVSDFTERKVKKRQFIIQPDYIAKSTLKFWETTIQDAKGIQSKYRL